MTIRHADPKQFVIIWDDHEREPRVAPNPNYPKGIDVEPPYMHEAVTYCKIAVPYPAPRCGLLHLTCKLCHINVAVTTAGRPDDPRSVTIPCKGQGPQ